MTKIDVGVKLQENTNFGPLYHRKVNNNLNLTLNQYNKVSYRAKMM